MSRLDDELRNAFKRESPPADFTERLLARVAQQPVRQPSWWQRLAMLLAPPKLRWVAIGATASLMLAIGAAQYSRLNQAVIDDNGKVAKTDSAPESTVNNTIGKPDGTVAKKNTGDPDSSVAKKDTGNPDRPTPSQVSRHGNSSINHRLAAARYQKEQELRAAGEAAKEKLMLALSIASAALNDAQKAVHDDGLEP